MENGTASEYTVSTVSAADRAIGVPRVGVGVVVLNNQDQVLIGKRKSPHGQGTACKVQVNTRDMVITRGIAYSIAIDSRDILSFSKHSIRVLDAKSWRRQI
jgi:hypothetical protein